MQAYDQVQRFNPLHTDGLSDHEVSQRQKEGLTNTVETKITKTNWEIIRGNVFTLFNAYNFIIALCLILVGAYTNLGFLFIIFVNVATGIAQELHAKKMVEDLSLLSAAKVHVIRGGQASEVAVEQLVLDDVMMLDLGKQICADSVVVNGEVEANEALLTGETDPIVKRAGDTLLSGSFVVSGKCWAKVMHVGEDNFATKLSLEAQESQQSTSKLLLSMQKIIRFTSYFIIPIGILLFIQAYFFRNQPMTAAVVATAAALLGMLPKGLVLLISISSVTGIIRLSPKKVLVQDLYSLENLAHVDVLCLDKTGTITEGRITVSDVFEIAGDKMPVTIDTAMNCFIDAMDDNNATFMALKAYYQPNNGYKLLEKTAFSSDRQWSSATFEGIGTIVLGAPEKLMNEATSELPQEIMAAQKEGRRILCLGHSAERVIDGKLPALNLVAAIGFKDPIRENVQQTLDFFKREGVDVKIISGDNPVTVSNIAKQAGLTQYADYCDMSIISTPSEIEQAAKQFSIFGRVTPTQKRELIGAFKRQGHTVAMTGDGVNDVLALKEADCSIAMAAGSDATKQIAHLVLLESDFRVLPDIVMEGRQIVNNMTRVGGIFLVKTIYSILFSILCVLSVRAYPFIPIQIMLIDMIEGYPSFFMQFEINHARITEDFLWAALRRALPNAIMIVLNIVAVTLLAPALGLSQAQAQTVIFCMTGLISILAVAKALRPFNVFRLFLCVSTTVGFYLAAYLFKDFVHLEMLTRHGFTVFLALTALSIPLNLLADHIANTVWRKA